MGWILAMPRDSYASESGFRRLQEEIRRRPPSPEEPAARPYTERDRRAQGRQGARVVPTPVRNDRIREVTRIVLEEIAKENLWFPPGPPP
jgi:hypothetical protein